MDSDRGARTETTRTTQTTGTTETTEARRGRGCGCWILLILVLLGGGAATGGLLGMTVLRAEKPLPGEAEMADIAKKMLMIPSEYADMRIPSRFLTEDRQLKPEVISSGKQLYDVQCALCHGQNGKGDGAFGKTMYPQAADFTSDSVQNKSDGQLYWMIAHGINLTGMPAFGREYGGANGDDEIWAMVAFIRSIRPTGQASP